MLILSIGKSSNMKTDEVKHLRDGDVAVVGAKQVQVQREVLHGYALHHQLAMRLFLDDTSRERAGLEVWTVFSGCIHAISRSVTVTFA